MVEIRFKKLISLISSGRDFSGHFSHTDLGISEDEEILGIDLRDLLDMERL